ncbi:MAG TPA: mechanosensitive ion channel domain-containing protein [Polyangiales bacterium]|nr:mechanosensitive ion channel domain-containing protein [Polyangiales bacterium]
MDYLKSIPASLREWLPALVILLIGILIVTAAYQLLMKRKPPTSGSRISQQLLIGALAGVVVVLVILELPIADAARGQLLSLLGILVTAAVALSSTTLLGNAMAGLMLRSIRNFKPGDFIVVEGHRGRVSELGLLRTEIQNERRDLTTLPNLYLVSNPVTVVRSSGTFISATVSLGYDVPRGEVEKCLLEAARRAGLADPFVFVLELGDFSITYQVAGFLEEVKYLLSAESELRKSALDSLHEAGIEIVSPTFMNQRQLPENRVFIPAVQRARREKTSANESRPEERMFDKAELAESEAKLEQKLESVVEEIAKLKKNDAGEIDEEEAEARIKRLEALKTELESELTRRREEKNDSESDEG